MCAHLGDLTLRVRASITASAASASASSSAASAASSSATSATSAASAAAAAPWTLYSTISLGATASPLPIGSNTPAGSQGQLLAAQDITKLLASSAPATPLPLNAVRTYERSADGAALIVKFNLTSTSKVDLELGGLGMALPESPGNPPAGIQTVVWQDPHVGGEHGFVEFVRVVDDEATLLVTAASPTSSPLEAWRPMLEDLGKGDAYEWTVASKAWAEEWATNRQYPFVNMSVALKALYPPFAADQTTPWPSTDGKRPMPVLAASAAAEGGNGAANPWNPPTSITLKPGETISIGLRLQLASGGPRTRDETLTAMGAPVLHAVPGFVLHTDLKSAALLVKPPAGATIISVAAEAGPPGVNASLTFTKQHASEGRASGASGVYPDSSSDYSYERFAVTATGYGRVRARVRFSDGTSTTAHYFALPPFESQVSKLGAHLADVAWLPRDYPDPFGRGASVMPWDRSACGVSASSPPCGHVLNDARAYDAGLSDDAGGGNPLGFASKVRAAPTAHEASRVDEYIQWTLYGVKPDTASPPLKSLQIREEEVESGDADKESVDGIRMTMFYYDKDLNNHSSGHFEWDYSEADKCHKPFGGPTWCMTENMANATCERCLLPLHSDPAPHALRQRATLFARPILSS